MAKRFFIQITVVMLVAGIFSSIYFYSICDNLRHAKEGVPAKLDHIMYDSTQYDAVFFGSSRVLRNINPLLFEKLTRAKAYNAGIDGANYTLLDLLIRKFIKYHGAPRYLFVNLDTYTMEHDTSFFFYPQFLPYMDDPDMQYMKEREPNLKTGGRFPFFGVSYFNDYLKEVAFYTQFNICPAADSLYLHRGFMPAMDTAYYGVDEALPMNFAIASERFKQLDSLCNFCTKNGCKIFFIMAPIYRAIDTGSSNASVYYPQIRAIETKYSIRELNFFTDRNFPKNMFLNRSHLNFKGAELYTRLLTDSFNSGHYIPPPPPINQRSSPAPPENANR